MTQHSVQVRAVESKKDMDDFLLLPWDVYENEKNWVPPLLIAVKQTLDTKKNPFWKHAQLQMWNAYKNGECVGRIAGVIDERHNEFHKERTGFWGFFECINDLDVAKSLFDAVESWAISKGMTVLRGPMNPSTNYECGMQISAFDTKPFIMMTQNPDYYPDLVEKAGYAKAKDLYAWILDNRKHTFDEKIIKHADRVQKAEGITFRHADLSRYDEEVEKLLEVYNDAWEQNWGFVPMTDEEFRHMAKEMKAIVIPELLFIVEVKGDVAGFALWLPDVNQVMEKIPDGKLFPTGLLKLLWHTKVKKTINRGRIITLGIKKKYRHLGLASFMYLKYYQTAPSMGYPLAECSWVLEDNGPMNQGLKHMNGDLYKTYRIYDKSLS